MVKALVAALAIVPLLQQPAAAQPPVRPGSDTPCRVLCLTKEQLIVGGTIVAGAAASAALTASVYAPEQAAELATGVVLSSAFTAAASLAVLGVTAYYYGPLLWDHLGFLVAPERAFRQEP